MPLAAVGAGLGAAGSIGSAVSGGKAGKNANNLAQQQVDLQKQQFGLTQQQYGLGNQALGSAGSYWTNLLNGGQAAVQATGPYASLIGQSAEGNRQAIMASTPRGGEQNLAIAQNYNQAGNNIARLYAGMQPLAAQGLQQVGASYLGSGSAVNPSSNIGAASSVYGQQMQNAASGAAGYGSLLYNAMNKQNGGSSGGKSSPTASAEGYNMVTG